MSDKQDRTGARTAADIERKYKLNWGQSIAEVMGIATDARIKAENVGEEVKKLDGNLNGEEIFNRLTENGTQQGFFKDEETGTIYINAQYLKSLDILTENLFAQNISLTGKFTHEVEVFLEPGEEEVETIRKHLLGTNVLSADLQKLYDSNGDGQITTLDMADFRLAQMGEISLSTRAFAKKSKLKLTIDLKNPEKFIQYTGKNMWSRTVSGYIGIYTTSHIEKEKKRLKKTLFSGTWSGGTITVPNTDDYMLFKISMSGEGTPILVARNGNHIRGIGGFSNDTPAVITYHFAATVSGENWTLVACNSGRPFSDQGFSARTITSIVGII